MTLASKARLIERHGIETRYDSQNRTLHALNSYSLLDQESGNVTFHHDWVDVTDWEYGHVVRWLGYAYES